MPRSLPTLCFATALSLSLLAATTTPSFARQKESSSLVVPGLRLTGTIKQSVDLGPEPPPTPPRKIESQADIERYIREYQAYQQALNRYYTTPLSQVDGYPAEVYSRHINRIVCTATAPTGANGGMQTWLGTRMGIKRVEKAKGVVRTYTVRDGLPGEIVEDLAVDKDGAVALVRLADGTRVLCWWEVKTDRWRNISRLPAQNDSYSSIVPVSRWRFVLTPKHLVLTPPRIETSPTSPGNGPEALLGLQVSFWQRDDLQAGRTTVQSVPWDRGLLAPNNSIQDPRALVSLAAVGETVFMGGGMGLIVIPEATLSAAQPVPVNKSDSQESSPTFLAATPPMLSFFREAVIISLAAHGDALYALIDSSLPGTPPRTELLKVTPVIQDGILRGVRQTVTPVPNPFSVQSYQYPRPSPRLFFTGNEPWIVGDRGFLHQTNAAWERRDLTGKVVPLDQNDGWGRVGYSGFDPDFDGIPSTTPVEVPPADAIPDAVAQAWLGSGVEASPAGVPGTRRRVAWIRQRFPYFYSPSATLAQPTPRPKNTNAKQSPPYLYGGNVLAFVPDTPHSDTVWYSSAAIQNHQTYLWQIPAKKLAPFYWSFADNITTPYVAPRDARAGKAIPLPALPVRVHLAVSGIGVRPEGVYVGTRRGVLLIPQASLSGSAELTAGATWVSQETTHGPKTQVFVNGRLFQAGPGNTLFLNSNNYQEPLLRYDAVRRLFVRETALPLGQVAGVSAAGIFLTLTTVTKVGNGTSYSLGSTINFIPLRDGNSLDVTAALPVNIRQPNPNEKQDTTAPSIYGPDMPFSDTALMQRGYTGSILWFFGRINTPPKPRYPRTVAGNSQYYGLAGYDVVRKRWTEVLELPERPWNKRETVLEQGGKVFAAFHAPDYCVWQYDTERDDWAPIAPALPADAAPDPNKDQVPNLWTALNGDVWLLTSQGVYHRGPKDSDWTCYAAPAAVAQVQDSSSESARLAVAGDVLLVGGSNGCWCFNTRKHTWAEVAPLASSLPDTPVDSFVQSIAVDKTSVYLTGTSMADGSGQNDGFFLIYDKKGGWTSVSASTLGVPRLAERARVSFDGKALWYLGGTETRRRKPGTGVWEAIAGKERGKAIRVPGVPNTVYLTGSYTLERYDETIGKVQTLLDTLTFATGAVPVPPRGSQIGGVTRYRDGLLAGTSTGFYRLSLTNNQGERLPLPALEYGSLFTADNGDVYGWDMNTIVHLPR